MEDTIIGISTALGVGAISIIRISGINSIKYVNKIFEKSDLEKCPSHTFLYGHIKYKNEIIDEVLVSVMRKPRTYTVEDVVEINCHGGINTTNKIVEVLLELGCRLAEPGEFTKRAFLNGRIDLVKSEAVNDLISSKSDLSRKLALNNINGQLTQKIVLIREKLVNVIANIEVNIDYPEYEEAQDVNQEKVLVTLKECLTLMKNLLAGSKNGRIINTGINAVLVGKPNVGKSSILNTLLDEEKAIVTDIAGTTRDIIEGQITLMGTLINFIDTAGIRETANLIEQIGVDKSKSLIKKADLVIVVLGAKKITKEEKILIKSVDENKLIVFVNKSDLLTNENKNSNYILGNTIEIDGLNNLTNKIIEKFELSNIMNNDTAYLSNLRQTDLIKKAISTLEEGIKSIKKGISIDIAQIDIKKSWELLGQIIGASYEDELIDNIFSKFCLGK